MAHRSVLHGSKFGAFILKLVTELGKHGYVDGPVIMWLPEEHIFDLISLINSILL